MKPEKKSWMKSLFAYAEGENKRLVLSVVLSVLSVVLGLVPFYCMYQVICLFAAGAATAAAIVKWCLLALAVYAVKILLFSLSTGVSHAMAYIILESLRLRLADRFLHAPLGDVENHSIGEIKNMMVDKIENMEPPLAHMIPEGAGHIVLPIISIAALLCLDWRLALASLVTFPLSFVCMGLTFKISGDSFARYDQSSNDMNSAIVEYIEGIEVIKAFGRAGVSYEKYAGPITDFRTFVVKWLTSTFATMKLSFALFPSTLIGTLPVALALANSGTITGAQAALVGPSGGDKSTVAKLIARFWDVTSGEITIGGVNVKDMPLSQLPEYVSFVTQDNFLFRCSLLENIRLGDPSATDEQVKAAARAAQCEEFIAKLPQGYNTPAGEAGKRLSGGEKQRISIARAILKNAPIIILDEATASIDPENEHLIQQAISALTRGKTIITIAHRLATVQNADQILVVEDGRIAEHGTHAELVQQDGLYRRFTTIREQAEGWHISAE